LAWSQGRFSEYDPAGDRIPGAVESVASVGVAVQHPGGWFGDNDITYFYESRLPGEAQPVEDRHFHPVEPRTLRFTVETRFWCELVRTGVGPRRIPAHACFKGACPVRGMRRPADPHHH